ncbi:MAG TPA: hypothetical protein DCP32_09220 [Anaerolineaceae bacterium]|nr:MAG: hypothetical protein A2X24_00435 [Chloroflexi bacterium GWB2_54_36]HAL16913.1 hypothetical protein [Anaerolineaceae bacterium]
MIKAYYRPKDLAEALEILSRTDGEYRPLGGGVTLSQMSAQTISVVDLQSLGLNSLTQEGQFLQIGATTTLASLANLDYLQPGLKSAIRLEANQNLRQQATVAGTLVSSGGRSTFGAALLALDALLHWLPVDQDQALGEWFALRQPPVNALFINRVQIPLNASLAFDTIGRTPDDLPVICTAVAKWPSGRTRITLGGFGSAPILALDAPELGGAEAAVRDALSRAADPWASAEYRQEAGTRLVLRLMGQEQAV